MVLWVWDSLWEYKKRQIWDHEKKVSVKWQQNGSHSAAFCWEPWISHTDEAVGCTADGALVSQALYWYFHTKLKLDIVMSQQEGDTWAKRQREQCNWNTYISKSTRWSQSKMSGPGTQSINAQGYGSVAEWLFGETSRHNKQGFQPDLWGGAWTWQTFDANAI